MAEGLLNNTRVFKIGIYMTAQQQQIQTGWHLRDVGLNNMTAAGALESARTFVESQMYGILPSDVRLTRIDALELSSKEYMGFEYANQPGTGPGTMAASFLAVMVALRSSQRARHRNGRFFLPLYGNPNQGSLDTGPRNAYTAFAANFTATFCGAAIFNNLKACIVSQARPANQHRPAIEAGWIDVEVARLHTVVTALRRRKIGVGA
jgi:hypothetical protein